MAYVAALLVASVRKASKARSADARSCDSNLVVILNPQQQKNLILNAHFNFFSFFKLILSFCHLCLRSTETLLCDD